MKSRAFMLMIGLMLALSGIASYQLYAQPSEAEAKQIFESIGCVSCHVGQPGQPAASWDLIIQFMQDWSQKYPTIDDAIANEVTYYGGKKFQSFDELMAQMAQNVGRSPDDPEIQKLKQFFQSFWGETAQAPAGEQQEQPQEEQTQPEESRQEQPAEQQEQPAGIRGGEEPREGIVLTVVSIALIIVIAAAAAVYLTRR